MKIFVAVPTFETIYPDTFKSIYGLDKSGHQVLFDFVRGYDCAVARNRIGKQCQSENHDYVLMVDNDIVLPSNALQLLLEDPKEVCIGIYASRTANNTYDGNVCAYKLGEFDYKSKFTSQEIANMRATGEYKVKIHGGGMGCALIRSDVFSKLSYPWYKYVNYNNGSMLSEDLHFCSNCANHNIPIYMDTRVTCGHIFRHVQWPD